MYPVQKCWQIPGMRPSRYFNCTHSVAGVTDTRFQTLMPDVRIQLGWLREMEVDIFIFSRTSGGVFPSSIVEVAPCCYSREAILRTCSLRFVTFLEFMSEEVCFAICVFYQLASISLSAFSCFCRRHVIPLRIKLYEIIILKCRSALARKNVLEILESQPHLKRFRTLRYSIGLA